MTTYKIKLYFGIGISTAVCCLALSCGSEIVDCNVSATFHFKNKTDLKIETSKGIIEPFGKLSINQSDLGPCNIDAVDYISPLYDNPTIIVNDSLCKTYTSTSVSVGEGPLGIANFESNKIGDNDYEFTYEFTESDFVGSVTCN